MIKFLAIFLLSLPLMAQDLSGTWILSHKSPFECCSAVGTQHKFKLLSDGTLKRIMADSMFGVVGRYELDGNRLSLIVKPENNNFIGNFIFKSHFIKKFDLLEVQGNCYLAKSLDNGISGYRLCRVPK